MLPVALSILPIGYSRLSDLAATLDLTQGVFVTPYVETTMGAMPVQRIDQHYIVVTQPDERNRVHYCRIPVVKLIYHNEVAFAPDADEQLVRVEQKRTEIERWLVGKGYQVRAGLVGIPEGVMMQEGEF